MDCLQEHHHCEAAKNAEFAGREMDTAASFIIWFRAIIAFGQLQRVMKGISAKSLTFRLRELEQAGILTRNVFAGFPLHVEYVLTEKGEATRQSSASNGRVGRKSPFILSSTTTTVRFHSPVESTREMKDSSGEKTAQFGSIPL